MRDRKKQSGFTLIELIVVIAVLAIIAAIAIPAFNGLEEQSRKRVCLSNQITLTRAFTAAYSLHDGEGFELESFLTEQGLTKEGTGYTGYCPSDGGVYTVTLNRTEGRITIRCAVHGTADGAYVALIGQNIAEILNNTLNAMLEAGSRLTSGNIDSEGLDALGNSAEKRAAVEAALKTLGFTTGKDTSWAISGNTSSRRIFWTEQHITLADEGSQVVAIRYNSVGNGGKGTYTVVMADVIRPSSRGGTLGKDYPSDDYAVIDTRDNRFTECSYVDDGGNTVKQDVDSKNSFEAAYAYYQSVLAAQQGG